MQENASFHVDQAQNDTDRGSTESTVHSDADKQEETRIHESVIQLDLIQDTDGESLKPQPAEQEEGNPLLHEEEESSLPEKFYDKSGTCGVSALFC